MSSGVEWIFELQDRMSGPASAITNALAGINKIITVFEQSTGITESGIRGVGDSMKSSGESAAGMGFEFGAVSAITGKVIDGVVALSEKLVEVGIGLAKTGLEASEMKRNLLLSFETLTGGAGAAADALDMVRVMADRAGVHADFAAGQYRGLLGAGLAAKNAQDILAASLDVGAQSGMGEAGAAQFQSMITAIHSMDKLTGRQLKGFGDLGIDPDKILDSVAKLHGITEDGARKLADAGKLSSVDAINAIMSTVQQVIDKGGDLGTKAMAVAAGSPTQQLTVLANKFSDLFADISLGPLASGLAQIGGYLSKDSETGRHLRDVVNETFGGMFDWIAKLLSSGSLESYIAGGTDFLHQMYNAGRDTFVILEAVFKGVGEALAPIGRVLVSVFGAMSDGDGPSAKTLATIEELTKVCAITVEIFAGLIGVVGGLGLAFFALPAAAIGALTALGVYVIDNLGAIWTSIEGAGAALYAIGVNMIDGLWDGIKASWGGMLTNFGGLVDLLPQTVRDVLGIHSPSRVMMELGGYTAEGFDAGLQHGGLTEGLDVTPTFTEPDMSPVVDFSAFSARGDAGGKSFSFGDINVVVTLDGAKAGNPHEIGQKIAKSVREELTDYFEEMALETGNAA